MAIIGISGKIGSGKDTIANIIEYHCWCKWMNDADREEGYVSPKYTDVKFVPYTPEGWQVKKFAGKLKQIIALLLGGTTTWLEQESTKNSLLPDEWQYWTVKDFDRFQSTFYALNEEQVIEYCKKNSNSQHQLTYKRSERTVRWLLQTLGTECMRDIIHVNTHINALFVDYEEDRVLPRNTPDRYGEQRKGPRYDEATETLKGSNWLITDLRFPNELTAIDERGGLKFRVERYESYVAADKATSHHSETALDDYKGWDEIIINNGTIEELVEKVRVILVKHKII